MSIIGQEGYDSDKFIAIAGKASEGVIITTDLNRDSEREMTRLFLEQYEAEYGEAADMVGGRGGHGGSGCSGCDLCPFARCRAGGCCRR